MDHLLVISKAVTIRLTREIMKKIFLAIASVLTAIPSFGQITGVGLARSEQKEELMTQDNDKVDRKSVV